MSSGDPNLDRRLSYAEALMAEGDAAAAADLMTDTLRDAPDWVGGWYRLGEFAQAAGRIDAAIAAFDSVVRLSPSDPFGAGPKRDLLRGPAMVYTIPSAFVETLFDQYAPRFESSLVDKLDYKGPQVLAAALGQRRFERALDLGCGTGLMGIELRPRARVVEGCDISEGMLRLAAEKGLYDRLWKQDLTQMPDPAPMYDLIVAADVFLYLGALDGIVGWAAAALLPGGTFAFTVEAMEGEGFVLRDSRRFAHSRTYVETLLQAAALIEVSVADAILRKDRDAPVAAYVVTARRPAS